MNHRPFLPSLFLAVLCARFAQPAEVDSDYALDWHSLGSAGGFSSGDDFALIGSVATVAASAPLIGDDFGVNGGFWSIAGLVPQASFETNLIRNPGAEEGPGSLSGDDIFPVPGWISTGAFTTATYDSSRPVPGPEFGNQFFTGGPNGAFSSATQTIDLSPLAADIDAGSVTGELSGYFGGFAQQNDSASLTAEYWDESGNSLSSISIGNVTAADRNNRTTLLSRAGTNAIPIGTRGVQLVLAMSRGSGTYNAASADNLSLVLRRKSSEITIFDNTGGSNNGYESATTNTWLAEKFCLGTRPFQLSSVALVLISGDNNGEPRPRSVRLRIHAHDPVTGKPGADTGVVMDLVGATNPIALPISFIEASVTWAPKTPFILEANRCYWAVLVMENGTVGQIASFSRPEGEAASYGRANSPDAGATWNTPDEGSNRKMLIRATPAEGANPMDDLTILSVVKDGNDLRLRFTSVLGQDYIIQTRSDLSSGAWTSQTGPPFAGTGATLEVVLPVVPGQDRQFFRVETRP